MSKKQSAKVKTIIIADDHPMIAEGLSAVIHEFTPYKVIATVMDGKALLHLLNSKLPDMILLDINMPKVNGIEAATEIKEKFPQIKIVVISMYGEEALRQLQKKADVDGFIPKLSEGKVFTKTIRQVMEGNKIFIRKKEEENLPSTSDDGFQCKMNLTNRETEILLLIKKGLATSQISEKLKLSSHTINTHRKNICGKLGISGTNALIKFVHENEI